MAFFDYKGCRCHCNHCRQDYAGVIDVSLPITWKDKLHTVAVMECNECALKRVSPSLRKWLEAHIRVAAEAAERNGNNVRERKPGVEGEDCEQRRPRRGVGPRGRHRKSS